jgi:predicted alpha/beta-hydrolase family hydrolase
MADHSLLLAPGASGGPGSMAAYVAGLAEHGVAAMEVALPRGTAERAVPIYRAEVAARPDSVIGGQSFGGRVASLLASEEAVRGLVLISYPLHPPGGVDRWEQRTEHWPRIGCPTLLLSGDRDPFARIGLLREAVDRLPDARLHVYPGVGHGLRSVLADAIERIVAFVRALD